MRITSRNIASVAVIGFGVIALQIIPAEVEDGESAFLSGAALLPDLAVSLMIVFAAADLALAFAKSALARPVRAGGAGGAIAAEDEVGGVAFGTPQLVGMVLVAFASAMFALLLPGLGYVPASILLLAFMMYCVGARRGWQVAWITVAVVLVLYFGVRYGFGVPLRALPDFAGFMA